MKEWFTAKELEQERLPGLQVTDRTIQLRAKKEKWEGRKRFGRGGGCEYHIDALPEEARTALAARYGNAEYCHLPENSPAAAGAAMGEKIVRDAKAATERARIEREANLAEFAKLSQERQNEAYAKRELLAARDAFQRSAKIRSIKTASERFCALYVAGQINMPEWVNEIVKRSGRVSLSWSSLNRWRKKYEKSGLMGLVNGYKSPSKTTVPEEVQNFIKGLVTKHPHIKDKGITSAIEARFDGQQIPHPAAVRRWTKKWKEQNASLLLWLTNPDEWKNRHQLALGDAAAAATALNQIWEMDSTPADLMLKDGRHTLIGCIDVWSRRLKLLVAPTSKSAHVAALVRGCIIAWGVPVTIKTDNGKDYVAEHMVRVLEHLEIEQSLCPPFTPECKPHIERAFRTFSHSIVELMPGYIGHNVAQRKDIEARKSFAQRLMTRDTTVDIALTADELQALCDRWVNAIYHQDKHSALGASPAEKARSYQGPIHRIADERALDMLLMPAAGNGGWRTVSKKGIRDDNGLFISAQMPDPGTQVFVRQDPADFGRIYLYDEDKNFICIAEDPERTGLDRAEVAAKARAAQKKARDEGAKILKKLAAEAKADAIFEEILQHREGQIANVHQLPQKSEDYTTDALDEALRAADLRDEKAPKHTPSPEHLEAQRRIEQEFAAEEQARTSGQRRKVEPIMTPQRAYAKWKEIEAKKLSDIPVSEKDEKFFTGFVGTADWAAMRKMEDDFGPSCYLGQ